MMTVETTPLEPDAEDVKLYCPDVGIVNDAGAVLTDFEAGSWGRWPRIRRDH